MLNLAGACLDSIMICAMFAAWRNSFRAGSSRRDGRWLQIAALFAALAFEKGAGLDATLQLHAREILAARDMYELRRELQVPLILVMLLPLAGLFRSINRAPAQMHCLRRARLLALVLLGFDLVRSVSLHQIDTILFAGIGPLHVNHAIEAGLTALLLHAAWPVILNRHPLNVRQQTLVSPSGHAGRRPSDRISRTKKR